MARLVIQQEEKPAALVLHVAGPLTLGEANLLQERLEEAWRGTAARVVVNLAGCPYMDTGGLAVLVTALKRARQAGRGFFLVGLSSQVQSVLQITRLDHAFDIRPTLAAALSA